VIGLLIAMVLVLVVVLGGDDEDPQGEVSDASTSSVATTPPTDPSTPVAPDLIPMAAADALEYFEVYGTQDPAQLGRMVELASPDTPARFYAIHQQTLAQIDPQRNAPLGVSLAGEQIEACPADPATGGCVRYSGFAKDAEGRITHFDINDTALRDRIAVGGANEVTAGGMRIAVITRYVSVSDRLFLAYRITNDGGTPVDPVSVRYLTPSGETVEPDNDTFRTPVAPGATQIAAAAFPTTAAGGTLAVTSTSDAGNSQQLASIQTP
jgi:hypothetical protein